jgi:hypothetical protein
MEGCRFCERLKSKVKPEEEWLKEHSGHGGYSIKEVDVPHPSMDLVWLVCKCGHRYLTERNKVVEKP